MRRTEDKLLALPAACTLLTKSDICLRMRMTGILLQATPFLPPYYCISPARNLTFVCAWAGFKISFQLYLRLALFWSNPEIFCQISRTGIQLKTTLPAAWTVLMKSDICMCMRRTQDKLLSVPSASTILMKSWNLFAHAQDRSRTGIQLKDTHKFFFPPYLYLTCQKSEICIRMRRTED